MYNYKQLATNINKNPDTHAILSYKSLWHRLTTADTSLSVTVDIYIVVTALQLDTITFV